MRLHTGLIPKTLTRNGSSLTPSQLPLSSLLPVLGQVQLANRLHERYDELGRHLRDDSISQSTQLSHSGGYP